MEDEIKKIIYLKIHEDKPAFHLTSQINNTMGWLITRYNGTKLGIQTGYDGDDFVVGKRTLRFTIW